MLRRVKAPNDLRAGRLVRLARFSLFAAALAATAVGLPAKPADAAIAVDAAASSSGQSIEDFYDARGGQPLWLRNGVDPARLLDYLRTADADGLDPGNYRVEEVAEALGDAWGGSPDRVRLADRLLSQAFVAYVRDLKRPPAASMIWVDPDLKPKPPSPRAILEEAAAARDLRAWLSAMGFMNPIYAGLRDAISRGDGGAAEQHVLRLNLERARALPSGNGRYILVNATAAKLTVYENGEPVDSMRVVVGKPKNPTPMMAAKIRFTSLNPYWYVPPDLAAERIAPNVVKDGLPYLQKHGYQVMGNWNDPSSTIDPSTIDWAAVAAGTTQVYLRQLPGPGNSMGTMKFMFPNDQGVYLHDTPQKELLSEASRMFSGGCVRLEDAPRLARWLHGRTLEADPSRPEQRVDLPEPVPVYITYLTVMPSGTELATFPDVYGRDRAELAMRGGGISAGR
jgi:murein L,D-transpeptidase YcbB/YkuD